MAMPALVVSLAVAISALADNPGRKAPQSSFKRAPQKKVETVQRRSLAKFRFRSNRRRARFQCRLDGRSWHRCRSPKRVLVGPGRHRFAVRARDRRGNVEKTEVRRRWRVTRWRPRVKAARRYARRRGTVAFAVNLGWRTFGFRRSSTAPMASTVKAMLMVAYLRQGGVRHRRLDPGEKDLLGRMIRYSDNGAATTVRNIVGESAVRRLARRARLRDFEYSPIWGLCRTSARDQASFMRNIDHYLPRRHEGFARRVLGRITPSQSWGIGTIGHKGWSLGFKGGWGIGPSAGRTVNHQIAVLQRGKWRIGIAILTQDNPAAGYGQQTLRTVAKRLLHGLPH